MRISNHRNVESNGTSTHKHRVANTVPDETYFNNVEWANIVDEMCIVEDICSLYCGRIRSEGEA